MRRKTVVVLGVAALAGTGAYEFSRVRATRNRSRPAGRRHVVTVNRPLDEVAAHLPDELTGQPGAVEVKLLPAPGDRGTEIHARAVGDAVSDGEIRRALRISRSLLEVGDVLKPGGPTTTPTVLNRALRTATRHGREEGLL